VNINNSGGKGLKNTAPIGELIAAKCASVVYECISCTQQSGRLSIIPDLWDQGLVAYFTDTSSISLIIPS